MRQIVKIPAQLRDSNKAAELLGKRYGIFKDNVALEVEPLEDVKKVGEEDVTFEPLTNILFNAIDAASNLFGFLYSSAIILGLINL